MTTHHTVHVPLSELTRLRVHCKNPQCRAVLDVTLSDTFKRAFAFGYCCPVCRRSFRRAGEPDWLAQLAESLKCIERDSEQFEAEFVLAAPE